MKSRVTCSMHAQFVGKVLWGMRRSPAPGSEFAESCSHQLTATSKIISHQGVEHGSGLLQFGKGL